MDAEGVATRWRQARLDRLTALPPLAVSSTRKAKPVYTLEALEDLAARGKPYGSDRQRARRRKAEWDEEAAYIRAYVPRLGARLAYEGDSSDTTAPDPTVLDGLVLDQLVTDAPVALREVVRELVERAADAAVSRQETFTPKGFAACALERDVYRRIAARAMVHVIPRLAPDRPPGKYLWAAAWRAMERARTRRRTARPLGLVRLPKRAQDHVPVQDLDERRMPAAHVPVDMLIELRRLLPRLNGRTRYIMEQQGTGATLEEIAERTPWSIRTLKREACRARAALREAGITLAGLTPWTLGSAADHDDELG